ncbi:BrnT family toxin [Microbulbifer variabilis]|uniref:BrnT family toxin n=1 Tax=Microbulbifer variabilis TaxID=266805 RepID=A0ABY4VE78_9GAMM|nr:BrnT family toxin [Microbulbifer variabilis]USD22561.1 BrnT family toxin [Microbulbifer variabilis]
MDFEWDENKRELNIQKHGIDFVSVIPVFDDPNAIEQYDSANSDLENRYQIIGMARPGVLFVAFTERDEGNTIRIISARRAGKSEIAKYRSMRRV